MIGGIAEQAELTGGNSRFGYQDQSKDFNAEQASTTSNLFRGSQTQTRQ